MRAAQRYTANMSLKRPLADIGRWKHLLICLLFVLLGLLLYGHTLEVPFQLDDFINIRDQLHPMTSLSFSEAIDASFKSFAQRRPLANFSFALNHYFHGLRLPGYHVVNIIIHVINGILLYVLTYKMLTLTNPPCCRHPVWIAGLSSLLWFVNPLQVQSVTYVVQRMTSLAALFFLLSFLFYLYSRQGRKRGTRIFFGGLSFLSFAFSVATKEWAWILPGLIFFYEWLFFQNLNRTWLKKSTVYIVFGLAAAVLALYAVYGYSPLSILTSISQPRPFTPLERLFTEARIIFIYMGLLLYPHPSRLNLNHDIAVSHGLLDPSSTLLSFIGLFGLLFLLVLAIKRRYRWIAFFVGWFLASIAVEALVADLELMFEHRVYLASMFFFMPFLLLFESKLKVVIPVAGTLIVVFGLWTYQRNALWTQPVAFWKDSAQKSPHHYRSHFNLGTSYLNAEIYDRALTAFKKSLTLSPPYPEEIYVNMGSAYIETGHYDKAQRSLNQALARNPKAYLAHNLLARLERQQGADLKAIDHYHKALDITPNAYSYHGLGLLYMDMNAPNKSIRAFREALSLKPNWADGYSSLGLAMAKQGTLEEAIPILEKATKMDPQNKEALFNLATAYKSVGRYEAAAETYTALTEIDPADIQALHNLGVIYYKHIPNMERATFYLNRALCVDPDYAHAAVIRQLLTSSPPGYGKTTSKAH